MVVSIGGPMPRRYANPDVERQHRHAREQTVREIKALLDLYWDLCGSWCAIASERDDIELRQRMMDTRAHTIALVCAMMPIPSFNAFDEAEALPDQCKLSSALH